MNIQKKAAVKAIAISGIALLIAITMTACSESEQSSQAMQAVAAKQALPEITVYKSPTCGCCTAWEEHLIAEGFTVISHQRDDMDSIKQSLGVKPHLASCHTATIGDYVIEGHVPADDIKRLLKERPKVAGLTAPGMPRHSPGMQPPEEKPSGYDVLAFNKKGGTKLFTQY
ncbi:MAG: DUF411 domain-containing protein [Candidatus Polarisedimenticolaceae bacterium]|nr:DUF411 domain-containing protein [Candidatus Polarisedimenticolaceae bacterium]